MLITVTMNVEITICIKLINNLETTKYKLCINYKYTVLRVSVRLLFFYIAIINSIIFIYLLLRLGFMVLMSC